MCTERGNNEIISKTGTLTCPVNWLLTYINLAGLSFGSDEYVFKSVRYYWSQKAYKLVLQNRSLSYARARESFLDALFQIDVNCKMFCLHNLRSGDATAAENNCVYLID